MTSSCGRYETNGDKTLPKVRHNGDSDNTTLKLIRVSVSVQCLEHENLGRCED